MRRRTIALVIAGAVLAAAAAVLVVMRGAPLVVAVPEAEKDVYETVLRGLAGTPGAPALRLEGYTGSAAALLKGRRPGILVARLDSALAAAISRGSVAELPAAAFAAGVPPFPAAFLRAVNGAAAAAGAGAPFRALPLVFDPWLMFWHRDFIGGAAAYPGHGRALIGESLAALAGLPALGLVQPGAFSFPWTDAVNLVVQKKAAGIALPLSRYRAIDPAASAPLISAVLPSFAAAGGAGLAASLEVAVVPSGARARLKAPVLAFLAETGTQRAIADALRQAPARLDAPLRDGAALEAREAARGAMVLLAVPGIAGDAAQAPAFAAAADAVLRSPGSVDEALAALYAGKERQP